MILNYICSTRFRLWFRFTAIDEILKILLFSGFNRLHRATLVLFE